MSPRMLAPPPPPEWAGGDRVCPLHVVRLSCCLFIWLAARPLGALFVSHFCWAYLTPHPAEADGRMVGYARPLCPRDMATVVIACICPLW